MLTTESGPLVAMLTAPAIVAALAYLFGQRAPRRFAQLGALTAGLGFLGGLALAVDSGGGGVVSATLLGAAFVVDRLAAVMLVLIFGVSSVVQAFAVRYLTGDPRAAWFTGGAGLLTAASAGLATAATVITLAVCWTLAGAALCLLLATYWHLPAARDGLRRTVIAFLIGDLALWVAVVAVTVTQGTVNLRAGVPGGEMPAILGVLVVVAALSRSAQIPFHRWLPATLAAPTPVSALLHAGVVNAGAILLIRTAPMAAEGMAQVLTIIAGAATMAYGAAVMLVKPDVKGALAHSTTAQMGFMILTCGLGLWAAAVIHLVAHGFYKATLFLSSGSAIAGHRRQRSLPPAHRLTRRQTVLNAAAAVVLPAAALAAALVVVPLGSGEHAAEHALLIFAWVTGAAVMWGWLQRRSGASGVLVGAAVLIPAAVGYVAMITALSGFLAPAVPVGGLPTVVVWAVTAAAAVGLGLLAIARRAPAAERLRRAVYTSALSAGHIPSRHVSPVLMTGARS